jgi:CAAX prenyl protease-like protein
MRRDEAAPQDVEPRSGDDPTTAYLAPFVAILATAMITGALSAGFDWLYPLRVFVVAFVLWAYRRTYSGLAWKWSWGAIAIGAAAFVAWIAVAPTGISRQDAWPSALVTIPRGWAAAWLLIRVIGYVVTVPLAEELAFRGYLTRRIITSEFNQVPLGIFTWSSFLASSILFGALHGAFWLPATIAGLAFALALYRRGAFGDAVQAHATTNLLIVVYAFVTGHWSLWS